MPVTSAVTHAPLRRSQLLFLVLATVMISAARYYCQPLLADMGRGLRLPPSVIGLVPALSQSGMAVGLLVFVPLGDMLERRRLCLTLFLALAAALGLTAISTNAPLLFGAAWLLGMFAAVSQLVVALAASLALPEERGRVVGSVTGGLLIGVLSARIVSGLVGGAFGWRVMYGGAAAVTCGAAVLLRAVLPVSPPRQAMRYWELVRSLPGLIRDHPALREASLTGGLAFGALNAFWTTLVFYLAGPPYHLGTKAAGLFGLAGIAGALCAPSVGRIADRGNPGLAQRIALCTGVVSFGVLWAVGAHMAGLIAGIVLLDLATQANLVSNQYRIYSMLPEAANRLNTVFMTAYFIGAAAGAALGTECFQRWGWTGLCALGAAFFSTALLVVLLDIS